jgi:hypothetical protein
MQWVGAHLKSPSTAQAEKLGIAAAGISTDLCTTTAAAAAAAVVLHAAFAASYAADSPRSLCDA